MNKFCADMSRTSFLKGCYDFLPVWHLQDCCVRWGCVPYLRFPGSVWSDPGKSSPSEISPQPKINTINPPDSK